MGKISEQQKSELKEAFHVFDKNDDGVITVSEIEDVLHKFGVASKDDETERSINSQKKVINFDQFMQMMTTNSSHTDIDEELLEAFKVFDKDGNGVISVSEMKDALKNLDENISNSEINMILELLDTNKDGEISLEGLSLLKVSYLLQIKSE